MRVLKRATALAATAAVLAATGAQAPAFAATALINGDFERVTATGQPEGWGPWKPAGNGVISLAEGPDGSRALQLLNDSTDDRTAVGQRIDNPDPSRVRYFRVSVDVKAENISGYAAAVRVQYVNGGVPLTLAARTSGTHDWRQVTEYVAAPAGTTQLSIEPMLDSAKGRYLIDNLEIAAVDAAGVVTASAQPTGEVELSWNFAGLTPHRYEIHRGSAADFVPGPATLLRTLTGFTQAEDATAQPSASYFYKVVALDPAGAQLGVTVPGAVTLPATFADDQRTTVLSATGLGHDVRVAWRLAAGTTGPVTLWGDQQDLSDSDLRKARALGVFATTADGVTLAPNQRKGSKHYALTDAAGTVLATASPAGLAHPRSEATKDRLKDARKAIKDGTPKLLWEALLARVAAGPTGTGYAAWCQHGAEAAFAYQVTGDVAYAARASRRSPSPSGNCRT
ncbi:fibronectin type III domain-containing protein [Catellatospora paridis]|uniref:hypothetical protein n=1 Tax=Catellatospora paridis TaxID=1617086 RepID=UPI0012D39B3C|nr:hypothetical protein [Catellatospora paridis]